MSSIAEHCNHITGCCCCPDELREELETLLAVKHKELYDYAKALNDKDAVIEELKKKNKKLMAARKPLWGHP